MNKSIIHWHFFHRNLENIHSIYIYIYVHTHIYIICIYRQINLLISYNLCSAKIIFNLIFCLHIQFLQLTPETYLS
jgi:hypothetical protein